MAAAAPYRIAVNPRRPRSRTRTGAVSDSRTARRGTPQMALTRIRTQRRAPAIGHRFRRSREAGTASAEHSSPRPTGKLRRRATALRVTTPVTRTRRRAAFRQPVLFASAVQFAQSGAVLWAAAESAAFAASSSSARNDAHECASVPGAQSSRVYRPQSYRAPQQSYNPPSYNRAPQSYSAPAYRPSPSYSAPASRPAPNYSAPRQAPSRSSGSAPRPSGGGGRSSETSHDRHR